MLYCNVSLLGYVPSSEDPSTCFKCGRRYRQKRNLKRHQQYECGKEPQFSCGYCSRRFHQKANLCAHILRHKQWRKNKHEFYEWCYFGNVLIKLSIQFQKCTCWSVNKYGKKIRKLFRQKHFLFLFVLHVYIALVVVFPPIPLKGRLEWQNLFF